MNHIQSSIISLTQEFAQQNGINQLSVGVSIEGNIIRLNVESCSIDLKNDLNDTLKSSLQALKENPFNQSTKISSVELMIKANNDASTTKLSFHPYHLDLCFTGKAFDLMLYLCSTLKYLDQFNGYLWSVTIGLNDGGFKVSTPCQINQILKAAEEPHALNVDAVRLLIEQHIALNGLSVSPELLEHTVKIALKNPKFCYESFFNAVLDKEWVTKRYINGQLHKEAFQLAHSTESYFTENLADVPNVSAEYSLKVGSLVSFTNDFGNTFPNLEVVGFDKNPDYGRCVFLNTDSYWFAVKPESLTVQSGYLGISQDEIKQIPQARINELASFSLIKLRNQAQAS